MTETSRRALLRVAAGGAVAAPVASVVLAPGATAAPAARPGRVYSRKRFTPLVGRRFTLTSGQRSWSVRLVEVSDLAGAPRGHQRRFALTFAAAKSGPPQGTYVLTRKRFRSTKLFVVPSDEICRTYEAVINRK